VFRQQFSEVEDACALAQAIVDTVREPLIVLDKDLRAIAASRSFYVKFATNPVDTRGKRFHELGNGEWDIPKLRLQLERIIPDDGTMENCEVEHVLPRAGKCVLLLSATIVLCEKGHKNILIGKPAGVFAQPKTGLGTGIVKALAKQLDSQVVTLSGPKGTTVSVTHATFGG
jgi:PAS domain-containing protein